MSEYKELIQRFEKIRSYVRDFYVYGFKTREDFREKSARTYDNHRRRMESWFSDYIRTDQNGHKKSVFLTLDSSRMAVNPLYHAWKSKTFTDNDISLHFFLSDLLADGRPRSLEVIADQLQEQYHQLFDTQTIRRKLAQYQKEGLVTHKKEGKQYLYARVRPLSLTHPDLFPALWLAVSFFQGAAPFGFIGSTILDYWNKKNDFFRFRSDYLIHTLEDEILLPVLQAMEQERQIQIVVKSTKGRHINTLTVLPLKILTSTQTGRRYVCVWQEKSRRLSSFRLDSIQSVKLLETDHQYNACMNFFHHRFCHVWGVSFENQKRNELETVCVEISLNETEENYILDRLEREGRGGCLKRLEPGLYQYTRLCADATEILPWIKSFTGRIRSFHCSNVAVEKRFRNDMRLMESFYCKNPLLQTIPNTPFTKGNIHPPPLTKDNFQCNWNPPEDPSTPLKEPVEKQKTSTPPDFSLFSELYTCYYQVVAQILKEAAQHPLTRRQIEELAREHGYDESVLAIVPRLIQGDWPFFRQYPPASDLYSSVLKNPLFPRPLTGLQKSWIKGLMSDSRFPLFFTDTQLKELEELLSNIPPLYRTSDFCLFDQYGDHDPFSSVMYREHMHTILEAITTQRTLSVSYLSRKGNILTHPWFPCRLEYGQRDGKFRLYGITASQKGRKRMDVLNVARILSIQKAGPIPFPSVDVDQLLDHSLCNNPLVLEITTERNALERAMLHFSCYQKKVERLNKSGSYRCTIYYDKRWETELLIQVLSFGPVIKVLEPESFFAQIQKRVENQVLLMKEHTPG